jgi:hypothetical protein
MDKSIRPLPRELRSRTNAIPCTKKAFERDLERVQEAWDDCQTDRRRDAIYGYLMFLGPWPRPPGSHMSRVSQRGDCPGSLCCAHVTLLSLGLLPNQKSRAAREAPCAACDLRQGWRCLGRHPVMRRLLVGISELQQHRLAVG